MFKKIFLDLNFLPSNINISYMWNGGSFLGFIMMIQLMSGIFLSMLFVPGVDSFWNLIFVSDETILIQFFRWIHSNGASLFFILIFFHISRGLYFISFKKLFLWISGCSIYILLMAAAFLGYVLPWGQMSLWGGSVITNLFGVVSPNLVLWIWGDFSVGAKTLSLFFSLHFLVPFILLVMVLFHIILLHESGSSSKILISKKKLFFGEKFFIKDVSNFLFIFLFMIFIFIGPWLLGDPENFVEANYLSSPIHIMPEWYFLWAYAILRAIPSKLGGVLALLLAVIILYFLILKKQYNLKIKLVNNILLIFVLLILTWLGGCPVESPFIITSQIFSFLYFVFIII